MRRRDILNAEICTVVVRLNRNSDLHIRTTASHAVEVLSGNTIFAAEDVTVFDLNGRALTLEKLKLLKDGERKA